MKDIKESLDGILRDDTSLEQGMRLTMQLKDLKRFREREPLVQEVLDAWNLWTSQEMYGEHIREGMVPSDFEAWQSTIDAVRDFGSCDSSATETTTSAADSSEDDSKT